MSHPVSYKHGWYCHWDYHNVQNLIAISMLKYSRYKKSDFTLFVVEPETPFSEWMDAIESYEKAEETKYNLFDTRNMTVTPDESDIRQLITHYQNHRSTRPAGSKTAVVVNNLREHWLVRLYSTLSKLVDVPWQTQAFFSMEEATDWLGIKLPPPVDIRAIPAGRRKKHHKRDLSQ